MPKKSLNVLMKERAETDIKHKAANKIADGLKKDKAELDIKIRAMIIDKGLESARVDGNQATPGTRDCYSIEDFDTFVADVKRTKAWDLLYRRVNETALKDRLEDGKKMPKGVAVFVKETLSFRKVAK